MPTTRKCQHDWQYYDGCLGYESFKCTRCGIDQNDIPATPHTPGPWRVSQGGNFVQLCIPGTIWNICELQPLNEDAAPAALTAARAQRAANARLIAAAPALLAALETLIASLQWEEKRSGTTYHGYEEAGTAIAAAKGERP